MSLKLISSDKLYIRMHKLDAEIKSLPNNLERDYTIKERDRLWKLAGWLDKRTQAREMREWNL